VYLFRRVDIIYTTQILAAQRQRKEDLALPQLPPVASDFTWIVGSADALTTMDRCMFKVTHDLLGALPTPHRFSVV
jgi:hypothetical protein